MFLRKLPANLLKNIFSQCNRLLSSQIPIIQVAKSVNPYADINIKSLYGLQIKPYDLLDCPDGNLVRASLVPLKQFPGDSNKLPASKFELNIEVDDNDVEIKIGPNGEGKEDDVFCLLEIPVKSNVIVSAKGFVDIQSMYGDIIEVNSIGDIITKNIQALSLRLESLQGSITCNGNTLARTMDLKVSGNKNIHLSKMQGDFLNAICDTGTISTDSCYVENSKFTSIKGNLLLKNVHKRSEIHLPDGGNLEVTGFHGVLQSATTGGNTSYQLTEVYGDSFIEADAPNNFIVNISEFVEEHTRIDITAADVILDETLAHLNDKIIAKGQFQSEISDITEDNLVIKSTGVLKLGKLSWMDAIKFKFGSKIDT